MFSVKTEETLKITGLNKCLFYVLLFQISEEKKHLACILDGSTRLADVSYPKGQTLIDDIKKTSTTVLCQETLFFLFS